MRHREHVPEFDEAQSKIINWFNNNPGVMATAGYLYLTTVGLTYSVIYYAQFGISILDYSDPVDYLAAGIREPILLLFSGISFVALRRLIAYDRRMRQKSDHYRRLAERMEGKRIFSNWILYPFFVITYFVSCTSLYADISAAKIWTGHGKKVVVGLTSGKVPTIGEDGSVEMIGMNGKFLFVYLQNKKRTAVIPFSSMAMLTHFNGISVGNLAHQLGQQLKAK